MAVALIVVVLVVPLLLLRSGMPGDERRNQSAILANLTAALADADELKSGVERFYRERGAFPDAAAAARIGAARGAPGNAGSGTGLGERGVITIEVHDARGATAGAVSLTPFVRGEASRLQWRCTTGDFRNISRYVPQCRYRRPASSG